MRASRLISLLLLLQAREVLTAAELARELEVSERTIYRDVLALSSAGVPVYADRGRTGGYRLLGGYRTRLTGMSRDEAEALFLAGLPGPAGDMGLAELAGAVWRDQVITLRYRRGERDVTRRTHPYGLVLKSGIWYLIGRVGDDIRTYRVDRVSAVEPHEETFDREPGFDLAGHWRAHAEAFLRSMLRAEVTIRLSPAGLRRLRHLTEIPFGCAEAIAAASGPDGQGWVTTRLPVESAEVAYTQLLGLGPEVEVLDPPELRALMTEATARAAALYTDADGERQLETVSGSR
ncbi:helix-turn-helix transcriptional regulator [Micromonospora sp. LOL_024]|uniref:helix-turn-helix transcriptional regulator n=1 Tax=Micromonospora sp. LOL_024 TaxID=3345412 RepID=UPI003A8A9E7D